MRKALFVAVSLAVLATVPTLANAQEAVTGAAGGAIAGAVVGGPVGAVVGGVVGGTVGSAAEADRRNAEGRVIVQERGPAVIVEERAPVVRQKTCVDNGASTTCTETR